MPRIVLAGGSDHPTPLPLMIVINGEHGRPGFCNINNDADELNEDDDNGGGRSDVNARNGGGVYADKNHRGHDGGVNGGINGEGIDFEDEHGNQCTGSGGTNDHVHDNANDIACFSRVDRSAYNVDNIAARNCSGVYAGDGGINGGVNGDGIVFEDKHGDRWAGSGDANDNMYDDANSVACFGRGNRSAHDVDNTTARNCGGVYKGYGGVNSGVDGDGIHGDRCTGSSDVCLVVLHHYFHA